jgi:hypothetical protein
MKLRRGLIEAQASKQVVRIVRRPKSKIPHWEGFVVSTSSAIVILHDVDLDAFVLNGYKCFRLKDIACGEAIGAPDQFLGRGVLLAGLEPVVPEGIDSSSMQSLLRSAGACCPLIAVHFEHTRPHVSFIGKVVKVGRRWLTLHTVDTNAAWDTVDRFRIENITRVDFDGGYERMLHQVNQTYFSTPAHEPPRVLSE